MKRNPPMKVGETRSMVMKKTWYGTDLVHGKLGRGRGRALCNWWASFIVGEKENGRPTEGRFEVTIKRVK